MAEMQPISEEDVNEAVASSPSAYISERLRNPSEEKSKKSVDSGNYTVPAILAIVAFLLFAYILFMLHTDMTAFANA